MAKTKQQVEKDDITETINTKKLSLRRLQYYASHFPNVEIYAKRADKVDKEIQELKKKLRRM